MKPPYEHRLLQEHAYAIVERHAAPDLPAGLPLVPLVPTGLDAQAHLLPCLLPLHETTPAQMDALFDLMVGQAPPIVYLLQASEDPTTFARQASKRMVLRQRNEGEFVLRYTDPRVWSQMLWMLSADQLAYWVNHAHRITFWFLGQWHSVAPTPMPAPSLRNGAPALSRPTFLRIARVGAINDVLAELPASGTAAAHQQSSRRIDELLDRAERDHQFPDEKDRIAFALHGMQAGASFDSHPRVLQLLQTLADKETTYRDAAALLSIADWQRISADLGTARLPD